jgi:hypothetical protein
VELETCNAAHADLDRALLRRYMSFACREAIRQFQADRVTVTTKKGSRGDRAIDETTKRREPPPVQCLNILIRACALLERLQRVQSPKSDQSQKKPATTSDLGPATLDSSPAVSPNDPYSIDASSEEMRRLKVENWLASERGKRKPRRPDGNIDFDCVDAAELVSAVLAEPHDGRALEIIAADIGKRLVDKAGAVIPVCQNPETETESNTETDEPRDLAPPPSPTRPLTRSSASDLALPASDDTLSYGERMRRELRARVNSICARSGPPPQPPAPQTVTVKLDLPKVISPPKVPPELQTLYDKVVHLQRMRAKRLPCSVHFTPEEESQLWRLPSIYLEDA